jgi:probable HAF family extracellular repeat protein
MTSKERRRWAVSLGVCLAAGGVPGNAGAGVIFQGLGTTTFNSGAVNYDGSMVAGKLDSTNGFRWTAAGGVQPFPGIAGTTLNVQPEDMTADGAVVVGESNSPTFGNQSEAFRWTAAGGAVGLGDLPGGLKWSYTRAVSADGNVVVGASGSVDGVSGGQQAFRWTQAGGMAGLGFLGGTFSEATGTNADGTIVVGRASNTGGNSVPFRWTAATGIKAMTTVLGSATAMTPDGRFVVGYGSFASPSEAFRWSEASGFERLGDLPGGSSSSLAIDVSDDGTILVGQGNSGVAEAMVWREGVGMRSLRSILLDNGVDLTGWTLTNASEISGDGMTVSGQGLHNGQAETYVAVIPEPAAGAAAAGTLALLTSARRRRACAPEPRRTES